MILGCLNIGAGAFVLLCGVGGMVAIVLNQQDIAYAAVVGVIGGVVIYFVTLLLSVAVNIIGRD